MRRSHHADPSLRGAVMSLALGGLLVWKPQIFVAAALFFAEIAQRALAPAFTSMWR